jgi:hypothetical protein
MIIQALNSHLIDLEDFTTEDFELVPIAKALNRLPRFAGNFESISVLQHCILVARFIEGSKGTPLEQLAGLHHDDAEAIVGDVPSPVKKLCPDIVAIENKILDVIDEKWTCKTRGPLVKKADGVVGAHEMQHHFDMNPNYDRCGWSMPQEYRKYNLPARFLTPWDPATTLAKYIDYHDDLCDKLATLDSLSKVLPPSTETDPCLS